MLYLKCKGQVVSVDVDERIADKYINANTVHFEFCERWAGMEITAQFTQNGTTYNKVVDEVTNTVILPNEIVAGMVEISAFGVHPITGVRITTVPVRKMIDKSGFVSDGKTPIPPTPDLYAQLLEKINKTAIPHIGANGNWWFDDLDSGISATAEIEAVRDAAIKAIEDKGDYTLDSIPEDYTAMEDDVSRLAASKAPAIAHEVTGTTITVEHGADLPPIGMKLKGKTTQAGTPSPDAPVDLVGVNRVVVTGGGMTHEFEINPPIGLPSIPNKSGKEWLYDEIDFERGVYIKRVGVRTITQLSSDTAVDQHVPSKNLMQFKWNNDMAKLSFTDNAGFCTHHPFSRANNDNQLDQSFKTTYLGVTGGGGTICFKDTRFTSRSAWNDFFKGEAAKGTPVTVLYPLEEAVELPIEDVLTADEIAAYRTLRIPLQATISNNQSNEMTIKYAVDTKTYIDHAYHAAPVQSAWEQRMLDRIDQTMIPMVALRNVAKASSGYTKAGDVLTGINYSSVLTAADGKNLVGLQVPLSTYYSALENPASVMYTQDIYQGNSAKSTYYGIVCSGFVSYVLGSDKLITTTMMSGIANDPNTPWRVLDIKHDDENDLFKIRRGDLMLNTVDKTGASDHVRIVRDLVHDPKTGRLIGFNVSESWKPFCRTTFYSFKDFLAELDPDLDQPYKVVRIEVLGTDNPSHDFYDTNALATRTVTFGLDVEPIKYSKSIYPDLGDGGKYDEYTQNLLGDTERVVRLYIPDESATSITYTSNGVNTTVMLADMPSAVVNDVTIYELRGLAAGEYVIATDTALDDPCRIEIKE